MNHPLTVLMTSYLEAKKGGSMIRAGVIREAIESKKRCLVYTPSGSFGGIAESLADDGSFSLLTVRGQGFIYKIDAYCIIAIAIADETA